MAYLRRVHVLDFRIASSRVGSTAVVAVAGELDMHTAKQLAETLRDVFEENARCVVIDLFETTMVDSAGLGVLASTAKTMQANGGAVILAADDPQFLRTLRITGLDRLFDVRPTLTQALDHVVDRPAVAG
jgi:anti-sigma B factor antagonist